MTQQELAALHAEAEEELKKLPGVVGVGYGLKEVGGKVTDQVVGCDFDEVPHLAGAVFEVYEKPVELASVLDGNPELAEIPAGVPLYWVVNEAIVELSDEDGLIDALEELGLKPSTTAIICDASGLTAQDTHRTGRTSGE